MSYVFFFFQAEDGIRDKLVTGVQTCALPIFPNGQQKHDADNHKQHLDEKRNRTPPRRGVLDEQQHTGEEIDDEADGNCGKDPVESGEWSVAAGNAKEAQVEEPTCANQDRHSGGVQRQDGRERPYGGRFPHPQTYRRRFNPFEQTLTDPVMRSAENQCRICVATSFHSLSVQLPRSPMIVLLGARFILRVGMTHGSTSTSGSSTVTS